MKNWTLHRQVGHESNTHNMYKLLRMHFMILCFQVFQWRCLSCFWVLAPVDVGCLSTVSEKLTHSPLLFFHFLSFPSNSLHIHFNLIFTLFYFTLLCPAIFPLIHLQFIQSFPFQNHLFPLDCSQPQSVYLSLYLGLISPTGFLFYAEDGTSTWYHMVQPKEGSMIY